MTWPPQWEIVSFWDYYFIASDLWFAYMFIKHQKDFGFDWPKLYSMLVAMGTDIVCHASGDVLYILQWVGLVPFTAPFIFQMDAALSARYGWKWKAFYLPVSIYSGLAMLSWHPIWSPNASEPWYYINHAIPHTMVVIMMLLYVHVLKNKPVTSRSSSKSQVTVASVAPPLNRTGSGKTSSTGRKKQ